MTMLAMSAIQLTGLITGNADIVRIGTLGLGPSGLSDRTFHCLCHVL